MLVCRGEYISGGLNREIEPVGESRSDLLIFQQLADRLGIGSEMAGAPRDWLERLFTPLANPGVSVEQGIEGPGPRPGPPLVPFAEPLHPPQSAPFESLPPL